MKKASVITMQYIDNYGSVLQTLATQEVLNSIGYESEIVNYTRENCNYSFLKKRVYDAYRNCGDIRSFYLFSKLLEARWCFITIKRRKIFDAFRKKYINLSKEYFSAQELMDNPPIADVYITGSDQTWNTEYNGGVLGEYFLNYAPSNAKKIALSVSIGIEHIPVEFAKEMSDYVKSYDGISVREESAVTELKELGYSNAVHVVDPSLMLSASEWIKLLNLKESKKSYVFVYYLNVNKDMLNFAVRLAKDNDLELVILSAVKSRNIKFKHTTVRNCKPAQFLELIKNARYVITDSFHGTAFSFNFNKNVYIFNPPKYSTRLTSILRLFDSEFRLVKNECWKEIPDINFDKVNSVLVSEREKAKKFLLTHLN